VQKVFSDSGPLKILGTREGGDEKADAAFPQWKKKSGFERGCAHPQVSPVGLKYSLNGENINCRLNGSEVSKDKCAVHEKSVSTGVKSTCRSQSVLSTQYSVAERDLRSTGGGVMPVVYSDDRGSSLPLSRI